MCKARANKQHSEQQGEPVAISTSPLAGEQPSTVLALPLLTDNDVLSEVPLQVERDTSSSDSYSDPTEAPRSDLEAVMREFCSDWITSLSREDLYSLSLFLFHVLQQDFLLLIAKITAKYLGKNPRTIEK